MSDRVPPIASLDRRSLWIALLVPATIVAVDLLSGKYSTGGWGFRWMPLLVAMTLIEVAVVAWVVGRYVRLPWLKWMVFGWTIALVDLGVVCQIAGRVEGGTALVFAQGAMLLAWLILSEIAWVWRLPVAIVAVAAILPLGAWDSDYWDLGSGDLGAWVPLLSIGFFSQGAVYLALRLRGFRLASDSITNPLEGEKEARRVSQFSIKHLLIWTSALAPFLTIVRLVEWRLAWWLKGFGQLGKELTLGLSMGLLFALGGLVIVWAVLGEGRVRTRVAVGFTLVGAIAAVLHFWSSNLHDQVMSSMAPWPTFGSIANQLWELYPYWPMWMMFTFGLLAALLLFLRASGQRLVRVDVTRPSGERAE